MKLKEFNALTCVSVKPNFKVPTIQINIKTGLFRINKEGSELIGLQDGDQIVFHQDEEDPDNWYVEKVKENGFTVRFKENVSTGVLFNNVKLAHEIAESVSFVGKSGKCLIAGIPTDFKKRQLLGVLTNGLVNV